MFWHFLVNIIQIFKFPNEYQSVLGWLANYFQIWLLPYGVQKTKPRLLLLLCSSLRVWLELGKHKHKIKPSDNFYLLTSLFNLFWLKTFWRVCILQNFPWVPSLFFFHSTNWNWNIQQQSYPINNGHDQLGKGLDQNPRRSSKKIGVGNEQDCLCERKRCDHHLSLLITGGEDSVEFSCKFLLPGLACA